MAGPAWTHVPAIWGESVGLTLPSSTGAEKDTEIVASVATCSAPEAGTDDTTASPPAPPVVPAFRVDLGVPDTLLVCVGPFRALAAAPFGCIPRVLP